jgi:hypothetical protein
MEHQGLSVKAYFAGRREDAITEMQEALAAAEEIFAWFHRTENSKWQTWYKDECLACYPHTHDLIECALSLLRGEGETIVRPFADFGAHNKHVSLYQFKKGNANFPYFYKDGVRRK